jgi:hypothetical protein
MLDQEFKYFTEHKAELFAQYPGKFIAIVGNDIVGVYDSENEAFIETSKTHALGTFLIKQCDATADSYTQTFHSRASFA